MIVLKYAAVLLFLIVAAMSYIKLAAKFNIIDEPNHRSSHSVPVLRGGGILFFLAVLAFFFVSNFTLPYFVIAIICVSGISFLDDTYGLSAAIRLPFHFITIALILYQLGVFNEPWLVIVLTLVAGVAFMNIFNFMDGINGITAFYSIVSLLLLLYFSIQEALLYTDLLLFSLLAVGVFTYYNLSSRTRIFAGDIGSMSMAGILFFMGMYCLIELSAPVVLLFVSVYLADSGLTIIQRIFSGDKITDAHRKHIYQRLVDTSRWSHLKVAFSYAILQLVINIIIIISYKLPLNNQIAILVAVAVFLLFLYYFLLNRLKTSSANI